MTVCHCPGMSICRSPMSLGCARMMTLTWSSFVPVVIVKDVSRSRPVGCQRRTSDVVVIVVVALVGEVERRLCQHHNFPGSNKFRLVTPS